MIAFNANGITLVEIGKLSIYAADCGADFTFLWRGFWICLGAREPMWGYTQDWYDGPIHQIGIGRLFRIGWMYDLRGALDFT